MWRFALFSLLPALVPALPTTSNEASQFAKDIIARAPEGANAVVKSVNSTGTGCAANSASFLFQDSATVAFDSLVLASTDTVRSKRCLITIDLQLDPAWKYTINKATTVIGYVENQGGSYNITYTAAGKKSETSGTILPTTDSTWIASTTSIGSTSAYGGGVAGIDVSLNLTPVSGQSTLITIDSIDITIDYSK